MKILLEYRDPVLKQIAMKTNRSYGGKAPRFNNNLECRWK